MTTTKRRLVEMIAMYGLHSDLYTMKRGVRYLGELRKDIIIIPPLIINGQYNKTKGHIHKTGHKELYHVMDGEAMFFMQKGNRNVTDCYAVKAKAGESVIVPGDYYHVTANIGKETLRMYNWISDKSVSDYQLIEDLKGTCYYFMREFYKGWRCLGFYKNKMYGKIPVVRRQKALKKLPEDLSFLIK